MKYTVIHTIKVIDPQNSLTADDRSIFEHEDSGEGQGKQGGRRGWLTEGDGGRLRAVWSNL